MKTLSEVVHSIYSMPYFPTETTVVPGTTSTAPGTTGVPSTTTQEGPTGSTTPTPKGCPKNMDKASDISNESLSATAGDATKAITEERWQTPFNENVPDSLTLTFPKDDKPQVDEVTIESPTVETLVLTITGVDEEGNAEAARVTLFVQSGEPIIMGALTDDDSGEPVPTNVQSIKITPVKLLAQETDIVLGITNVHACVTGPFIFYL